MWKNKEGLWATYGLLLDKLLKGNDTMTATNLCKLLANCNKEVTAHNSQKAVPHCSGGQGSIPFYNPGGQTGDPSKAGVPPYNPGGQTGVHPGGQTSVPSYNPGGQTGVPSYNPGGQTGVPSYNPGGQTGVPSYNPGGQTGVPSYNPGGQTGVPSYNPGVPSYNPGVPSYNPGGQTGVSSYNPGGQTGVPPYNPGGQASVPSYNPGGQTGVPPYNPGGQAGVPPYNPGGQAGVSPYNPGGQTSVPPYNHRHIASIPPSKPAGGYEGPQLSNTSPHSLGSYGQAQMPSTNPPGSVGMPARGGYPAAVQEASHGTQQWTYFHSPTQQYHSGSNFQAPQQYQCVPPQDQQRDTFPPLSNVLSTGLLTSGSTAQVSLTCCHIPGCTQSETIHEDGFMLNYHLNADSYGLYWVYCYTHLIVVNRS